MYRGPEQYLERDPTGARLMAHARLLLKLGRRFEAIAPAGLRHAARVANYKAGKIVIHAENGAVATKIRQMSQRLCSELSKGGLECHELEVKVQPRESLWHTASATQKPLSAGAFETLRARADTLPDGGLRKALEKLLQRAAKKE